MYRLSETAPALPIGAGRRKSVPADGRQNMTASSERDKRYRLEADPAPEGDSAAPGATVDQGDIDALLAEFQSDGPTETLTPPLTAAPMDSGNFIDGPIGQDDIDRLLDGGDGPVSAVSGDETPDSAEDALADTEEDNLTDQEKMDRLIAELQEGNRQTDDDDEASADEEDSAATTDEVVVAPEPAPPLDAPPAVETNETPDGEPEAAHSDNPPSEAFDALDDEEADFEAYNDDEPVPMPTPEAPVEGESKVMPPDDAFADAPEAPAESAAAPSTPETDPFEARLTRRRAVALPEKKTQRRWLRWISAAVVIVVAAVGGAVGYRHFFTPLPALMEPPAQGAGPQAVDDSLPPSGAVAAAVPYLRDSLEDRFMKMDAARQAMLDKQTEILQLRRGYEAGIVDIERVIVQEAQRLGITRYGEAVAVDVIDYGLRTIQRRLAIMKQLDAPVGRLHDASEAILYAKRLASINLMLVGLAEGIDTAHIGRQMDEALATHPLQETLLLPLPDTKTTVPLETLWQRIADRAGRSGSASVKAADAPSTSALTDDARLWNAICEGDFSGKYQITSLSTQAAHCLAGWQGSELFLNRLAQLQVADAAALSAWKGQWMTLNRVEALSAAAAQALFQWRGSRLSLNGLRQLPDGAAEAVANWTGKELELMGLERLTLPMAKALAHWKGSGGRLFVPEKFYQKK